MCQDWYVAFSFHALGGLITSSKETVISDPELVAKLVGLVSSPALNVVRNALELLLVIGNVSQDFNLLHNASLRTAAHTGRSAFDNTVFFCHKLLNYRS
jgi:hypothetical protein